jgi:hypothetical protein
LGEEEGRREEFVLVFCNLELSWFPKVETVRGNVKLFLGHIYTFGGWCYQMGNDALTG